MDSPLFIPLVVLIAAMLVSRLISERALGGLSREQKGEVIEAFSTLRQAHLLIILVLLFVVTQSPATSIVLMIGYFLGVGIYSYRKLNLMGIPASYTRSYAASLGIQVVGLSAYLGLLFRSF
ncbi:MAG: hypothetical protein QNK05_16620 [Myxococcota bacterium]|nr:hypothetical protein [Myxococcota bacterium]